MWWSSWYVGFVSLLSIVVGFVYWQCQDCVGVYDIVESVFDLCQ